MVASGFLMKKDFKTKIGTISRDLEYFYKNGIKNTQFLDNITDILGHMLACLKGQEVSASSEDLIEITIKVKSKDIAVILESWVELFGEHSFVPYHLGGNILEGDPNSYDVPVFEYILENNKVQSLLDIGSGCGNVGNYFYEKWIEVLGIDGDKSALNNSNIQYPGVKTLEHDFTLSGVSLDRMYDIGLSIEFLEHVEEKFQENYLSAFKSCKKVYATFAPPGQPGHHHVNCRERSYWIDVFDRSGFDFKESETKEIMSIAQGAYFKNNALVFENRTIS